MAKKKVSRQSVRRSVEKRKQEQKQGRQQWLVIGLAVILLLAALGAAYFYIGSGNGNEELFSELPPDETLMQAAVGRALASIPAGERNNYYSAKPEMVIDTEKEYEAVIITEKGDIHIKLYDDEAPLTVNNFVFLANQGFYDGLTFHRVLDGFMAQGGDPTGVGTGGPGYQFEDETGNGIGFDRAGLLAMANSGPNTNGSQFFITYGPQPHLNGLHTIFGELISGEEALNSLTIVAPGPGGGAGPVGDSIERIDILER